MGKANEETRRRWLKEIEAWRESEETLSGWARRRDLSRDALEYWKRQFADREAAPAVGMGVSLIQIAPGPRVGRPLELIIARDALRVVLPSDFDAGALSRLLDVVEARC